MKNWRPEGWDNFRAEGDAYMKAGGIPEVALKQYHEAYEAGADAMLEAFRAVHSLEGFERMTEVILKPE